MIEGINLRALSLANIIEYIARGDMTTTFNRSPKIYVALKKEMNS